jgi:hypothetical protein
VKVADMFLDRRESNLTRVFVAEELVKQFGDYMQRNGALKSDVKCAVMYYQAPQLKLIFTSETWSSEQHSQHLIFFVTYELAQ